MNKRKEKQNNRPNLLHLAHITETTPTPPLIFHLLFTGGWVASPHTSMAMDGHVPAIQLLPVTYKSSPDHPGRTLAFFPSPLAPLSSFAYMAEPPPPSSLSIPRPLASTRRTKVSRSSAGDRCVLLDHELKSGATTSSGSSSVYLGPPPAFVFDSGVIEPSPSPLSTSVGSL